MKILIRHTRRALLLSLFVGLVTAALLLSLLRLWLLPDIDAFRQQLETRIADAVGGAVRIESLSARLHGVSPEIRLNGLNLLDARGRSAIRFALVRLDLDSWRTLRSGELRFERVEIVGPKLLIRRRADGHLVVGGLTPGGTPPTWLLADGRIALRDAEIVWQDDRAGKSPLNLGKVDLRLRNDGDQHRLSATLALPKGLGRSLRLAADVKGDVFATDGWRGKVYLEGKDLDLARLAGGLRAEGLGLAAGRADLRLWLTLDGGVREAVGDFALKGPILARRLAGGNEHRVALKSLASRFRFHPDAAGWRLDLASFGLAFQTVWPASHLALSLRRDPAGKLESVAARASYLDLADVSLLVHGLGLAGDETGAVLRGLAPRGTAHDVRFFYSPGRPAGEQFAACGTLADLATNAYRLIPGLSGFTARFCGSDRQGRIAVAASRGQLDLNGIGMRRPVPLDHLEADAVWRQTEGAWLLEIPRLDARNTEMKAQFRLRLALPTQEGHSPFLDLSGGLAEVDVAALRHYCPTLFMPETSAWIERSLLGGRIPRWDILFRGFTADYPFYDHQGVFESRIEAEELRFRYADDWPLVTEGTAIFEFEGPTASVEVSGGRIGSGRISSAHADIEDLFLGTWVRLRGDVLATLPESLDFLAQSPLKRIPERLNAAIGLTGDALITMRFDIPLAPKLGAFGLEGEARLFGAGVRLDRLDLSLDQLEGRLTFNPEGLRLGDLRGRFLDEPVQVHLGQDADGIRLNLQGRAGIDRLRERWPAGFWQYASGASDFDLDLRFPATLDVTADPLRLELRTGLEGVTLALPEPFGKPAENRRELAMETRFRAGDAIPLNLRYGSDVGARLQIVDPEDGGRLAAGDLAVGFPLPATDLGHGFTLAARLNQLDLGAWRSWWRGLGTGPADAAAFRELHLAARDVLLGNRHFGAVDLALKNQGGQWRGRVTGERAEGALVLSPDLLSFDLEWIKLPELGTAAARADAPGADAGEPDPDPAEIPSIQLKSRRLLWKDIDLGGLDFETDRRAHGMILRRLKLKAKTHQLGMTGNWTRTPNRAASTHLEGQLHIPVLGDFLALVGRRGEVRETTTDLGFELDWPGAPQRGSPDALTGRAVLTLGRGGLLQVEPGLGRVIGMLNWTSLWRRLTLDFSDLFGKGLAYDGMAGTFRIGQGQARTDAFVIDAVSAKVILAGQIGLKARSQDLLMTVIPHTAAALPLAGTLAGGPAVGAAMFLAEQLIGEQVDHMTASQYAIRGDWTNPVVTRIYRNLPLDVLDQAWSGVKNLSGFGSKQEETKE